MLSRFLNHIQLDRAVQFTLLTRIWSSLGGIVSILLIVRYFSPELQGFYYTFGSILALQTFIELGLFIVVTNIASHEWAYLSLDSTGRIIGKPEALSRLVSLGRLIFEWYIRASVLFVSTVSIIGYLFFSKYPHANVNWQAPWLVVVGLTGLLFIILPFNSLLEGCNQVASINIFRFIQSISATAILWLTIACGGGLWAAAVYAGISFVINLYLLLSRYRRFFEPFFKPPAMGKIKWKTEIWPMQWKVAIGGLVSYFAFSLFNPVMFHYKGAVVAGQMGITLQMVGALQGMAMAWVSTKIPQYGILIAQRNYYTLDRLWLKNSLISLVVIIMGSVILWVIVYYLHARQIPLSKRLLPPLPLGVFLLATILVQISYCLTAYLRAHKQEPIMFMGVVCSIATGLLVWLLGSRFGPIGSATGYLAMFIVVVSWETIIWKRCRACWHRP